MPVCASKMYSRQLRNFVIVFIGLTIGSYIFLSYWEYSQEFYQSPTEWSTLLQGHGTAPAQYRVGVLFLAKEISRFSHAHLAMRHALALLDLVFLTIGVSITFFLLSRARFYREASYPARWIMHLLASLLLLFYLSWTLWYHKPETIANFALLVVASALIAGTSRVPSLLAMGGLILISAYMGTIRADSGLALNLGLLFVALFPGDKFLPLGRVTQIVTGIAGIAAVLGVEFYIKYILYPQNPFSDSLFQLVTNLKSPINLFCVVFALTPYFLILALSRKYWKELEGWECVLILASIVEFIIFFVVARVDEVRAFIPYAMVLLPTSAMLLYHQMLGQQARQLDGIANETQL